MTYVLTARLIEALLRLRVRLSGSEALRERLVLDDIPPQADIWIHGASVGELTSARPIIDQFSSAHRVIITANSRTGRDMVKGWGLPARLAPLDTPGSLRRFLDSVNPMLALMVEAEFWPLRSRLLAERGITQASIGARMSERSAARWRRMRPVIAPILGRIDALSAQDEGSEARLRGLGLPDSALLPRLDLKMLAPSQITPPPDDPDRALVVLAASTHEGEDAVILDGWMKARKAVPGLRLILAPRHPHRCDKIAGLISARGLQVTRRSEGADDAPLLLADTLGEMPLWYARAGICIVAGSLTDSGGHTPWEPAAYRCSVLHGPHISNHAASYAALTGVAIAVDAGTLGGTLAGLAGEPERVIALGHAARDVLDRQAGDSTALIAKLNDLVRMTQRHNIQNILIKDFQ